MSRPDPMAWSLPRAAAEVGVSPRTFVRSWKDELVARGATWPAGDGGRRVRLRFDPAQVLALREERRIRLPGAEVGAGRVTPSRRSAARTAGRTSGDVAGFMSRKAGSDSPARYPSAPVRDVRGTPPAPVTDAACPDRGASARRAS